MLHLHILRHAKTNQLSPTGKDYNRELLPKGHLQLTDLSRFFEKNPLKNPTDVWISSAKRTQQTFEGIQKILTSSGMITSVHFFDELYLASDKELLRKLWRHSSKNDLLIIGHNFGISDLASYFTEQGIELRTGEYVQLSFDCNNWNETSRGLATVANRYRPLV